MLVTLLTEKKYVSVNLPRKVTGQFTLNGGSFRKADELKIEGIAGRWQLKLSKNVSVPDETTRTKSIELSENKIFVLRNNYTKEKICVYTENDTEDRKHFEKKIISVNNTKLIIGREAHSDIVIDNRFVSGRHAELVFADGRWTITDLNSTNGTFVNCKKIKSAVLNIGDVIFIMGFKIIICSNFISVNNPDGCVSFQTGRLANFANQKAEELDMEDYELPPTRFFYRSPRFKRDIAEAKFKVDSPPNSGIGDEMPLMLVVGPSVTMGLASMTTAIFAVNNAMSTGNISGAIPSIVMSLSMLLGTLLWPLLTKRYEKKRKKKKEEKRQKMYHAYLNKLSDEFDAECAKQAEILHENNIHISECVKRIEHVQNNLWERGMGQNDFLSLRLGIGQTPLNAEISYAERRFTIEEDNLMDELYALCEAPKIVKNVPINVSFFDDFITGVIGNRRLSKEFAYSLIFQLVSLYGYDELKLAFIYDESEKEELDFVKWLPHVWNEDHKFRFIATNNSEVKELSNYFEKIIENRAEIPEADMEDVTPYYVIFAMNKELAVKAEMLKKIYANKTNLHFSVITFYNELKNVPKECTKVIELDTEKATSSFIGKIFDKDDITGQSVMFRPEFYSERNKRALSTCLSNVFLDTTSGAYNLPSMVTFLQMYGVGKVEHLNAPLRWKENDPTKTLEAPVGIDTLGDCFKLDLHEKYHGPHGLVAGMTGSGKSEFIITYILSLAVNYHPNEVAFILIDYKGGGMAKAFETLPHTAGIITNLDGAAVKRSLTSIESELKRRQAIFADVSKRVGVSNIDIYKYQKLYREGKVTEPLQHLFIISDEFAELKTQQPEFMEQLISAARIGRSLGVHLILATQKPSGVVDDQIWSNSKFRVCLKVQERSDSMDMLKRPDAAELAQTGRFYLQVGYNELFELGQSAWAGALYYPSDRVITEKDDSVDVIDKNGRIIKQARMDKRNAMFVNQNKQLDEITDYLKHIAEEEGIKIKPLWLDPIPEKIYLGEVVKKYNATDVQPYVLNPVIGEYDDPVGQRQDVYRLPLSKAGNTVVFGAAGSGKTTFITTMVYSLLREHTPDEVNLYLLDFAGETLGSFSKAPHVGDVIMAHEEEKVSNLFKMLRKEVNYRKKLFSNYGGDYRSYIESSDTKLPSIVIVINNFAAFVENFEEKEDAVAYLSREGAKYGIYFLLTSIGVNAVRFRILQNFGQQIVLQLNDETDYSTILGKTDGLFPAKYKGRGLMKRDRIYEFQIANVCTDAVPFKFVREECARISASWNGASAKRVPVLPDVVDTEFIGNHCKEGSLEVPIGVECQSLDIHTYSFDQRYIEYVLSQDNSYSNFAYELASVIQGEVGIETVFIDAAQSFIKQADIDNYVGQKADIENEINSLFELLLYRNNTYKDALEQGTEAENFDKKVYVINSLHSLRSMLGEELEQKIDLILEKGEVNYNIRLIIADSSKNLTGTTYESWYKKQISTSDCIWIGPGITDQYYFKSNKTTQEMYDEINEKFAFTIIGGKATKIKILDSREAEE